MVTLDLKPWAVSAKFYSAMSQQLNQVKWQELHSLGREESGKEADVQIEERVTCCCTLGERGQQCVSAT